MTNATNGVWAYDNTPKGTGFKFSVPASTTLRKLKVYVGAYAARGKFVVALSDGSAPSPPASTAMSNTGDGPNGVFTATYAAASANRHPDVTYTVDQDIAA